jgi:hypothetical protein
MPKNPQARKSSRTENSERKNGRSEIYRDANWGVSHRTEKGGKPIEKPPFKGEALGISS